MASKISLGQIIEHEMVTKLSAAPRIDSLMKDVISDFHPKSKYLMLLFNNASDKFVINGLNVKASGAPSIGLLKSQKNLLIGYFLFRDYNVFVVRSGHKYNLFNVSSG